MERETERYRVWKHREGQSPLVVEDDVSGESPLAIRVAGRTIGITMRTPGHDTDLVLGFLLGEGLIRHPDDVVHVRRCDQADGDLLDVIVSESVAVDFSRLTRHVFASSSCGVCGSTTIDAVRRQFPRVAAGPRVGASTISAFADSLRVAQTSFDKTGGLHGAALFDPTGQMLIAREDVGRHNAVDKVVGHVFARSLLPLSSGILMVSGRASFEIVQKALAAGIPIVAAVSAPSSLAIDLATESNITLIGFLRPGRFNVYSGSERIAE